VHPRVVVKAHVEKIGGEIFEAYGRAMSNTRMDRIAFASSNLTLQVGFFQPLDKLGFIRLKSRARIRALHSLNTYSYEHIVLKCDTPEIHTDLTT